MVFLEYFDNDVTTEVVEKVQVLNVEDLLLEGVEFPIYLKFSTSNGAYVLIVREKPQVTLYGALLLNAEVVRSTDPDIVVGSYITTPYMRGINVETVEPEQLQNFDDSEGLSDVEFFSVQEDLKLSKYPIRRRYAQLIKDYTRYVNQKAKRLTSEDITKLNELLLTKFQAIINEMEDLIVANKSIATTLGERDKLVRKAMDLFQREYRKLLIAKRKLGYIPKLNQVAVKPKFSDMFGAIQAKVFAKVSDKVNINNKEDEEH